MTRRHKHVHSFGHIPAPGKATTRGTRDCCGLCGFVGCKKIFAKSTIARRRFLVKYVLPRTTNQMTCRFESGGKRISLLGYGAMRLPTTDGGHANNWAKDGYSSTVIDQEEMKQIIRRPVAMASNLHNAIFLPETLDMHFSYADAQRPACDCPYYHLNLADLLKYYKERLEQKDGQ